ncbi:MAG: hypothetical protein LIO44_03305, partial [Eubacterium sp.]|nr:hypothetical protein [Eubacterium sp.]
FIQSDSENEKSDEQADTADSAESIVENDSETEEENYAHIETVGLQKSAVEQPDRENLIADEILSEKCSDRISASENAEEKYTGVNPKEEKPVLGNPVRDNPVLDNPIRV